MDFEDNINIVTSNKYQNRPTSMFTEGSLNLLNTDHSSLNKMKPLVSIDKGGALAVNKHNSEVNGPNKLLGNPNAPSMGTGKIPPPPLLNKNLSSSANPFDRPKPSSTESPDKQVNQIKSPFREAIPTNNPKPKDPKIPRNSASSPKVPVNIQHPDSSNQPKLPGSPKTNPPNLKFLNLPNDTQPSISNNSDSSDQSTDQILEKNIHKNIEGISPQKNPITTAKVAKGPIKLASQNIPKDEIPSIPKKNTEINLDISEIFNILTPFLDHDKFYENNSNVLNDAKKFVSVSEEGKNFYELVLNEMTCCVCNENNLKTKKLNCGHCFCTNDLMGIVQNSWKLRKLECPKCKVQIKESEELRIYDFCGKTKSEIRKAEMLESLKNSTVKCGICEKPKKNFFVQSCLHACQECQASLIRVNKSECPKCNEQWDLNTLTNIEFRCSFCEQTSKFIEGFGKYVHGENCLLCLNCIHISLLNRACLKCKKRLKKIEKCELNEHLFGVCIRCKKEEFRGYMSISNCCQKSICMNCSENTSCRSCSNN